MKFGLPGGNGLQVSVTWGCIRVAVLGMTECVCVRESVCACVMVHIYGKDAIL